MPLYDPNAPQSNRPRTAFIPSPLGTKAMKFVGARMAESVFKDPRGGRDNVSQVWSIMFKDEQNRLMGMKPARYYKPGSGFMVLLEGMVGPVEAARIVQQCNNDTDMLEYLRGLRGKIYQVNITSNKNGNAKITSVSVPLSPYNWVDAPLPETLLPAVPPATPDGYATGGGLNPAGPTYDSQMDALANQADSDDIPF